MIVVLPRYTTSSSDEPFFSLMYSHRALGPHEESAQASLSPLVGVGRYGRWYIYAQGGKRKDFKRDPC